MDFFLHRAQCRLQFLNVFVSCTVHIDILRAEVRTLLLYYLISVDFEKNHDSVA